MSRRFVNECFCHVDRLIRHKATQYAAERWAHAVRSAIVLAFHDQLVVKKCQELQTASETSTLALRVADVVHAGRRDKYGHAGLVPQHIQLHVYARDVAHEAGHQEEALEGSAVLLQRLLVLRPAGDVLVSGLDARAGWSVKDAGDGGGAYLRCK